MARVVLVALAAGSPLSYVMALEHALGFPWWSEPLAGFATVLVCAWVINIIHWG